MHKNVRWITETAVMLALLVALQAISKPLGQLVTGSFVNSVLAVTVLLVGIYSGITVALLSPIFAFLLGIAPNLVTVLPIMLGNTVFVAVLSRIAGKDSRKIIRQVIAWVGAAIAKFSVLYATVVWLVCGVLADLLLSSGLLKAPMLKALPATFSLPQLITALIGGGVALLIAPVLRKALKK